MHADRRAGRVPALGQKHRVAEHVDVAALERGEDLGELALVRLAGDGARVDADVAHRGGDVGGVLDARGVEDAGNLREARLVEVGDRDVERPLVEELRQLLLVEVLVHLAAPERHLRERANARARRDADAAKRRDHAAARGLGEVEARSLGGEEVGDVAGDQRAGRGHADEDGAVHLADAGARLLAERGVGLVADHDRVRVRDLLRVADEPLVGLDRDRAVGVVVLAEKRRRQAVLVAAVRDLADELVDEVPAVGEDQDAAGARRLDESDGGDGLAGARRVLEPEPPRLAGVLGRLGNHVLVVLGRLVGPVLRLLVGLELVVEVLLVLAGAVLGCRLLGGRCARAVRAVAVAVGGCGPSSISVTSAASVPESASTWWSFSSAPSRSVGGSISRTRSRPSISE